MVWKLHNADEFHYLPFIFFMYHRVRAKRKREGQRTNYKEKEDDDFEEIEMPPPKKRKYDSTPDQSIATSNHRPFLGGNDNLTISYAK